VPKTWAISGVDLHLSLEGGRVRTGIESALREAVRSGRLRPGVALPPSRSLAVDLGVARNTVAAAYAQLVAEGWLTARQGSGTRVAERTAVHAAPAIASDGDPSRVRYDLRAGVPDVAAFPRSAWLAAARKALTAAPADALGYGDPAGALELRIALAEYVGRARGVDATPGRIVVCSGFAQGLALVCAALRSEGARSFAAETYGHREHRDAITAAGLELPLVPVDSDGAVVDELGDADAALLTPAHQFPLGVALAAQRRRRAVEWARQSGGVIVEDDYDGEFRYDRQPVGAMQALAPDNVIYAGTASKSLAPGLRVAWLVVPSGLVAAVVAARRMIGPSALEQLTLAELIRSGAYDRHVRRARLAYRRRRDHLVTALGRSVPSVSLGGIAAGLQAVVELPDGRSEDEVVDRARGHGLALEGLGAYCAAAAHASALVVGYAKPPEHAFSGAVARLCAVLAR